ncbi:OadG family protein [Maribellus mangrovi]|uniref:OadG family protein n=1 Tax=Maribellus mangrovi TaxID=3133146 RepID=UPI0030EEE706
MEALFILLANSVEFGMTVAIVGFLIVFFSLTILVIVFTRLPKIIKRLVHKRDKTKRRRSRKQEDPAEDDYDIEGNVTAALSLALHLYFNELHDEESNVVTIKKVKKAYSPWSSKIYSVNQNWPK